MDKESDAYKKALLIANEQYGTKSSIYRSSQIVKLYKKFGGKIRSNKKSLTRWFKEEWIQVIPYLEKGEKIECGGRKTSIRKGKACRPLYRVTKDTPITVDELLKIHPKEKLIKSARKKEKSPNKILLWKNLTLRDANLSTRSIV